jgi:hypothetical protein
VRVPTGAIFAHEAPVAMLPLLLLLATWGAEGAWPPGGPRQAGDTGQRRDSVARVTSLARPPRALIPALWSNDYGGVTVGLRARPTGSRDPQRSLFVASAATSDATSSISLYGRWTNPLIRFGPRVTTSVAVWSVEGRSGAAVTLDGSSRRPGGVGADRHIGVAARWMATTNLGYLDRGLWDDAGSLEIGPWFSTAVRRGEAVLRAKGALSLGLVYQHATSPTVSGRDYHYRGFNRVTGEVSVRTPLARATTFGWRVFGGAYLGPSHPVRQLRVAVAGADPYETFANPFLRSGGALLVRPDFHYHAPGGANLRGFRNDVGGRWAVGVNLELTRALMRRNAGFVREAALEVFVDLGVVDTLAVPSSPPGQWYTTLYDGGFGLVTQHRVRDLAWTMRFEVPIAVNRWNLAADYPADSKRFALRWQVSFSPSF